MSKVPTARRLLYLRTPSAPPIAATNRSMISRAGGRSPAWAAAIDAGPAIATLATIAARTFVERAKREG